MLRSRLEETVLYRVAAGLRKGKLEGSWHPDSGERPRDWTVSNNPPIKSK